MITRKKKFLIVFVILGFSFFFIGLCFQLCPSDQQSFHVIQFGNCPISSSSFAHFGNGLTGLFILPLIGLFLLRNIIFTHEGFVLLPFRPPRFHF
jgi:hypothetical protein